MKLVCLVALLGVASALNMDLVQVPDTQESQMPALLRGENVQSSDALSINLPGDADDEIKDDMAGIKASALLQGGSDNHAAVKATNNLRAKIVARMNQMRNSKLEQGQGAAEHIAMNLGTQKLAASANLLGPVQTDYMIQSLMQVDSDANMNKAVQAAVEQKKTKRVTLEELIVAEDRVQDTMSSASSELSAAFTQMMASHKQCMQCKADCPALNWRKYKVHTMSECQKNCKLMICKEWSDPHQSRDQEVAQFEEERKQPPKFAESKFSSYIEQYTQAHGQDELTVDDEGKFDIVWEVPGQEVGAEAEEFTADPVEQLRALDKWKAQKSSEDILKLLALEVENKDKDRLVSGIV